MQLSDEVEDLIKNKEQSLVNDKKLTGLLKSINDLSKQGLLKKQTYSIPSVDTIGKRLYESIVSKKNPPR